MKLISNLLIITWLLFSACKQKPKENIQQSAEEILVSTTPIQNSDYTPVIQYSGMMASTNEAKLSFKVAGIISHIYVKEGDKVSKGQLLATLNLTEINAQVEQSKQALDKAKRDVNRVKNLFNDTAATLEQLQNVQTQLDVAKENNRIALFNQGYAQIHALTDGVITKKIMNEGELASSGSPVFIINEATQNDWVIRFGVADKDWSLLKKGDKAKVAIDAFTNKTFAGVVTKKAEVADPMSNTYEIEVKVLPGNEKFATGLFATVQLNGMVDNNIKLLPVEALAEADDKKGFVFVLNADKKSVKKIPVQIAFITKNQVAIQSGLENNVEVITKGVSYLSENSIVKQVK